MRKIIKISLILLMAICITGSVYAASSCNISMKTTKTEYSKGDTVTIDVNISDIKSNRGIISFGGTLEYDKDSLSLEKMEGLNGWETPIDGSSYNKANGKFAITRSGLGKKNETILRLKFKVKNANKTSLTITLKNMTLADGSAPIKVNAVSKKITIKGKANTPSTKPGTDKPSTDTNKPSNGSNNGSNQNNNSKPNSTTNKKDSTVSNKKIPQTGENNFVIPTLLGVTALIAIAFFVKIKLVNNKANKM